MKQRGTGQQLMRSGLLTLLLLCFVFPTSAQARGRSGNPAIKLARGIINLTTGWMEVPIQIAEHQDETFLLWIPHGFFQGLMQGGTRTFIGAWDIITFPVAPYDAPLLEPDTLIAPRRPPRSIDTEPAPSPR